MVSLKLLRLCPVLREETPKLVNEAVQSSPLFKGG